MIGALQSSSSIIIITSSSFMLGFAIVSWIKVLLLPGFFVLGNFDNRSALAFCSLGTYVSWRELK
jgi:uncharacterized RDD family membrane protein YckC